MKTILVIAVISGSVFLPSLATAQTRTVTYTQLRNGDYAGEVQRLEPLSSGRVQAQEQVGAGGEHASTAVSGPFVTTAVISSYMRDEDGDGTPEVPMPDIIQLEGFFGRLSATGSIEPIEECPQGLKGLVLTNNSGDRYRNGHAPRVLTLGVADGKDASDPRQHLFRIKYNYAPADEDEESNARARSYSKIVNACGEVLSVEQEDGQLASLIIAKENDDCSEHDMKPEFLHKDYIDGESGERVLNVFGVYGCNGNGRDDGWASYDETRCTFSEEGIPSSCTGGQLSDVSIITQEQRSRMLVEETSDPNLMVYVGVEGNTNPPNQGVEVGLVRIGEGGVLEQVFEAYYARSSPGNDLYETEPRGYGLVDENGVPTGVIHITNTQIHRVDNRTKGEARMLAGRVQVDVEEQTISILNQRQSVHDVMPGLEATHVGECAVDNAGLILSSSHSGNHENPMVGFLYNWTLNDDVQQANLTNLGQTNLVAAHDNRYISNILGNNPRNQGKNFLGCKEVPNPYFNVDDADNKCAKTLVVMGVNPREVREGTNIPFDKLSTGIVVTSGVIDGDCAGTAGGNTGGSGSGGGCSTGQNSSAVGLLAFLGLIAWRRRRNEAV